jgi:hypothetical protein
MGGTYYSPSPPTTPLRVSLAEAQLGFALPALLRDIYTKIANGGFGPGYGIVGIDGGAPFYAGGLTWSNVDLYKAYRQRPTRYEPWGEKLLPICHWGCTFYSYLDCALTQAPVMAIDENSHGHGPWACAFSLHVTSFEQWMQRWLDGEDLWQSVGLYGNPKFGYEELQEGV